MIQHLLPQTFLALLRCFSSFLSSLNERYLFYIQPELQPQLLRPPRRRQAYSFNFTFTAGQFWPAVFLFFNAPSVTHQQPSLFSLTAIPCCARAYEVRRIFLRSAYPYSLCSVRADLMRRATPCPDALTRLQVGNLQSKKRRHSFFVLVVNCFVSSTRFYPV